MKRINLKINGHARQVAADPDLLNRPGPVKEAARPLQTGYSPITYPGAVVKASAQAPLAEAFLDQLVSPAGQQILARYGFRPVAGP